MIIEKVKSDQNTLNDIRRDRQIDKQQEQHIGYEYDLQNDPCILGLFFFIPEPDDSRAQNEEFDKSEDQIFLIAQTHIAYRTFIQETHGQKAEQQAYDPDRTRLWQRCRNCFLHR